MSLDDRSNPPMHTPRSAGAGHNARWGMILFLIYLAFYAGFVGLATYSPQQLMSRPVIAGVNLAIVYGFALIVGAFVMAIIYMKLCRPTDIHDGK